MSVGNEKHCHKLKYRDDSEYTCALGFDTVYTGTQAPNISDKFAAASLFRTGHIQGGGETAGLQPPQTPKNRNLKKKIVDSTI